MLGGSERDSQKSGLLNKTDQSEDDDDDLFHRVQGEMGNLEKSGQESVRLSQELIERASAQDLVAMIREPEDPRLINLAHDLFKYPQELWDKILCSQAFQSFQSIEKDKLMMFCRDVKGPDKALNLSELEKQTDNPLIANLPKIEFIDIKARIREEQTELLILTKVSITKVASFKVDAEVTKTGGNETEI